MDLNYKHSKGQYFTTNIELKEKLYSFVLNNPEIILEPCIGKGDLVTFILNKIPHIQFDMYEIDNNIPFLENINKHEIHFGDFMQQTIKKKYKTIVGNPPFVRTKKGNLYIDFTEKCYQLLDNNGELVFIVPTDFLKLTSASKLLNEMMNNGTFTHIYHANNEKLFEDASIDVIIFRYCKNNSIEKKTLYNDKLLHIINSDGLITFSEKENNNKYMLKDYFDIYVGIVSGKEEVYKNSQLGNISVINGEKKLERYLLIEKFPCENEDINNYLLQHKDTLITRSIKQFNESNWFEWGALRNVKVIKNYMNSDCIYVYNLTRNPVIAFVGKVNYFGGGLIMLKPKKKCDLSKIVSYLNSEEFKCNFMFSGRFKIGQRQLCNSYIDSSYIDIDTC